MNTHQPGLASMPAAAARTWLARGTGAAVLAGTLAAGAVWFAESWSLSPWFGEGHRRDFAELDTNQDDSAGEDRRWSSDLDQHDDPDDWSVDSDDDIRSWGLTE